ncbi:hypothetical protein [Gemmatimonas sp. UBA7669]|uniref:hypothetical protein n=1 Tax=Gemmatimonas sp. UBA7669 TaxID=1946568 RepID=UPI0025BE2C75|nr:hypothetical protein [Gemmatimonas sp. UBA7669]
MTPASVVLFLAAWLPAIGSSHLAARPSSAQPPAAHPLCVDADAFLRGDRAMQTMVEPDTVNDWRTRQRQFGCKVTAAGATTQGVQREAVYFYERVRATGWVRTPDPRDAPNEGALRFRKGKADCLFNVYGDAMLMTDAEMLVEDRRPLKPGEVRYHVYAMCMTAMPAAARDSSAH